MNSRSVGTLLALAALLGLTSCSSKPARTAPEAAVASEPAAGAAPGEPAGLPEEVPPPQLAAPNIRLGTGAFVQSASAANPSPYSEGEGVTLSFEQADLNEFLSVVFSSILQANYLVDGQVRGTVTLHTSRPVTPDAVLPIVEAVLESNGAAVVFDDGVYKIMPIASAELSGRAPTVGRNRAGSAGFGTQVVPLEHVAASEIEVILRPFVADGTSLRVDRNRNVVIVTGPRYRVDELLATIRTFDVDWLAGMSFGTFRLQYADATTLAEELEAILGGETAPLAGIVRVLPIARLNAVLVVAHRPEHIAEMRRLIDEFDRGVDGGAGKRLFVYALENGKAESIAASLQQIFTEGSAVDDLPGDGPPSLDVFRSLPPLDAQTLNPAAGEGGDAEAAPIGQRSSVKIIADQDNNAILVLASQEDYRAIEAAIRRLDIPPRQVLIEATIAEVALSKSLNYGVRWFLETSNGGRGFNAPVPTVAEGAGLALAFFDDDRDLTAFFDLLANESSIKFLSTPQVMVLDNQTANIRVGDQIPVTTRSSQSTTNPDAPIVTEVQFRDTGTMLSVTPRINASGQVALEISQEVSVPGTAPAVGGGGNVSIAQRTINSSVVVPSGQTVVLGGLVLETKNNSRSGIPGLMKIPGLGRLFSSDNTDSFRTELIVTVTPKVIENPTAMRRVTEELRERMQRATEYESAVRRQEAEDRAAGD